MEAYGPLSGGNQSHYSTTGYAGQAPAVPIGHDVESASRIRDGITQAEQVLSNVHEAISAMEKRLDTVLTPAPPQLTANAATTAGRAGPVLSHLGGRVSILNEGFDHAVARLRDLTRRLDV